MFRSERDLEVTEHGSDRIFWSDRALPCQSKPRWGLGGATVELKEATTIY